LKYSKGKEGALTFNATYKQVNSIDSDGCRPPKNWEKNFRPLLQESDNQVYDPIRDQQQTSGGYFS
jgi:hypothetical protein